MAEVVVVAGARTPSGSFGGTLSTIPAPRLGAIVIKEALKRANITGQMVDEVIMGTHFQAGIRANSARQAAIYSGIPVEVPAWTPNKNCGTGLKAIHVAAQSIITGDNAIVVAGGCENMSDIPYLLKKARFGYRMGSGELLDSMFYDGLIDPFENYHMGITAENVAEKYGISREQQDEFAYRSHVLASKAAKSGFFKEQIVPVTVERKKESIEFSEDETIRHDISLEKLAQLKPAFKEGGTVTAGNASGINDGAAAVVMMSRKKALELGLKPRLKIVAQAAAGVQPSLMGIGPVLAIDKLLKKEGLKKEDIDLFEINEAFAAQAVACIQELGLDLEKVNVNGGAIALGHPVGCTGARLMVSMMYELERRKEKRGVIALCIGGGQGIATLVERCEE
ncbi:MAG: acetyl-CoA C-acetyltransferase [Clostridia bacterium]|nr:acetyl-CoA C-acetyltransferase [Clostridia bacterium]